MDRWRLEEKLQGSNNANPIGEHGLELEVVRYDQGALEVQLRDRTLRGAWGSVGELGQIWMTAMTEEDGVSAIFGFQAVETATGRILFLDRVIGHKGYSGEIRDTETWTSTRPPGEWPPTRE
jgi:hypothetical protein